METWVLVLIIFSQTAPGIASIPGYSSEDECARAGAALHSKTGGRFTAGDKSQYEFNIRYICSPGPKSAARNTGQ